MGLSTLNTATARRSATTPCIIDEAAAAAAHQNCHEQEADEATEAGQDNNKTSTARDLNDRRAADAREVDLIEAEQLTSLRRVPRKIQVSRLLPHMVKMWH